MTGVQTCALPISAVAVNSDGSVTVNEYNWGNFHRLNVRTFPANTPSRYLHF